MTPLEPDKVTVEEARKAWADAWAAAQALYLKIHGGNDE